MTLVRYLHLLAMAFFVGGQIFLVAAVVPSAVGAILMSISTIVVAINAQLLRRLDLRPD